MSIFKTKAFRKLFFTYSCILITVLMVISIIITNNFINTMKQNQLYLNRKMVDEINEYLIKKNKTSDAITNLLYRREIALRDIINFLDQDVSGYLEKRLDSYTISDDNFYDGISSFVRTCYSYDKEISRIAFFSFVKKDITFWDKYGGVKEITDFQEIGENIQEECIDFMNNNEKMSRKFRTVSYVRKSSDLRNVGIFIVEFQLNGITEIIDKYDKIQNRIIITDKDGMVKFDSKNELKESEYTWEWKFKTSENIEKASGKSGIIILGILPNSSVLSSSKVIIFLSIVTSLVIMIISIWLIYLKINKLSLRTEKIIVAMEEVKEGRFDRRIVDDEKDEIALIADNFNEMCFKLQEYVNRAYLSEIKQKNAQLLAMESQINPHFLYNTLEAVRMKALINGDREVSNMLYSMSVIYRNITKGDRIISLEEEIKHSRLYLELFKCRYEERFNYYVELPERLKSVKIIKLSIQPLIENFIIHGMRKEEAGNFIAIIIKEIKGNVFISVKDNGRGIGKEKLKHLKNRLKKLESSSSLGLLNVHERIKLTYGYEWGVDINSKENEGTEVTLNIPNMEVINVD